MLTILPHIEYLLRDNDCVIVPGFGAFISHRSSAVVENGMLIGPKRLLGFNEALQHNDGLLVNSIMRKAGISYDRAIRVISDDVAALKMQLIESGEAYLEGIGRLLLSEDNLLSFEPLESSSVDGCFFGLQSLRLSLVDDVVAENDTVKEHKPELIYLPVSRNIFKIAASIIVLVAMAFVLSTPISLDDDPDYAGFVSSKSANISPEPIVSNSQKTVVVESDVAQPDKDLEADDLSDIAVGSDAVYYGVVATFKTRRQAELYMRQSSLPNLKINGSGSLYRVYAVSGNSYEKVLAMMEKESLFDVVPDAWIYKDKNNG